MTNVFYVKDNAGRPVTARFLSYRGICLRDPNVAKAQNAAIFTDEKGEALLNNGNPSAYFIVPSNYTVEKAVAFSGVVTASVVRMRTFRARFAYKVLSKSLNLRNAK